MTAWIGYRWLAEHYGVATVQAFRTDSAIAKTRSTMSKNGYTQEYYLPSARPADSLAAHLTFVFKHEGMHLEFLARLLKCYRRLTSKPALAVARVDDDEPSAFALGLVIRFVDGEGVQCS